MSGDTGHPGYALPTGSDEWLLCERCGAVIAAPDQHNEHHDHFERLLAAVEHLTDLVERLVDQRLLLAGLDPEQTPVPT